MAQDAVASEASRLQRNIMARPVGGDAVQTVIGAGPGDRGPWSIVTGIPHSDVEMMGPPAQYLAVAAWAA